MKKYRGDCKMLAIKAMREQKHRGWEEGKVRVIPHWYFTDRRQRDMDNLSASLKAAFDGLQDAGVVKNDNQFISWPDTDGPTISKYNPHVILELEAIADL
ncbi:MAG: hypothetical protein WC505_08080 [Patescibacteria group bacterium]